MSEVTWVKGGEILARISDRELYSQCRFQRVDNLQVVQRRWLIEIFIRLYYRNGTLLYTSTVAPTYPLQVDTSLHTVYAGVYNVVITSNTPATSGNIQWLVTDQLGAPRMIFDQTGSLGNVRRHDYLPFGEELVAGQGLRTPGKGYVADTVRQKFTSYERDSETNLDFAQARYYAGAQGRFTSTDPIYFQVMMTIDPQRFNLYAYARNNPLKYVDPTGARLHLRGSAINIMYRMAGGQEAFDTYFVVCPHGLVANAKRPDDLSFAAVLT